MKNLTYFNVSAQQVTAHGCQVIKIEGALRDTTAQWVQVHDATSAPADTAVPIKSWPLAAGGTDAVPVPFLKEFSASELGLVNGLYICLSTTDATKTLSADKMDLSVEISRAENTTTVVGDNTTGVTELLVWEADATENKRLMSVRVDGGELSEAAYIMLFHEDAPDEGSVPLESWPIAVDEVVELKFGEYGRIVRGAGLACEIGISSTAGVLTTIAAQTVTIRAEYK